jgi:hypothetical protein
MRLLLNCLLPAIKARLPWTYVFILQNLPRVTIVKHWVTVKMLSSRPSFILFYFIRRIPPSMLKISESNMIAETMKNITTGRTCPRFIHNRIQNGGFVIFFCPQHYRVLFNDACVCSWSINLTAEVLAHTHPHRVQRQDGPWKDMNSPRGCGRPKIFHFSKCELFGIVQL